MKNYLWIVLILSSTYALSSTVEPNFSVHYLGESENQNPGLSEIDSQKTEKRSFVPNPARATRLAALIPGSGQIYNRDYWKAPLVYAALAGGTWTAIYWQIRYQDFVRGYLSFYDLNADPDNKNYGKIKAGLTNGSFLPVYYRGGILNGERQEARPFSIDQMRRYKDAYRRYFELSVVVTAAIYVVSIIEANVAVHLKTFDMSDDLTFRLEPKLSQPIIQSLAPGVRLVFNFK
ncbi:DUF5683 domain-containing protein [Dyadobacter sp. CY345]|uniref:DUF5683 domain-containing protein n=1 Tax=Dyadobacter sp. CY345 TaxID=2909335 RepID=UPI001F23F2E7|nr:DUF5683 domain-containing protein [Dyadobacter sp. CY345]MCF2446566.1 DUF5683 domain-containing protein [Dyadobacter sp. CY345]